MDSYTDNTIEAIIESLRGEPWEAKRGSAVLFDRLFAKGKVYVNSLGRVFVCDGQDLRVVPTSLKSRLRLALAWRKQRHVQLNCAWRTATTLAADGPQAQALFDMLSPADKKVSLMQSMEAEIAKQKAQKFWGYAKGAVTTGTPMWSDIFTPNPAPSKDP